MFWYELIRRKTLFHSIISLFFFLSEPSQSSLLTFYRSSLGQRRFSIDNLRNTVLDSVTILWILKGAIKWNDVINSNNKLQRSIRRKSDGNIIIISLIAMDSIREKYKSHFFFLFWAKKEVLIDVWKSYFLMMMKGMSNGWIIFRCYNKSDKKRKILVFNKFIGKFKLSHFKLNSRI